MTLSEQLGGVGISSERFDGARLWTVLSMLGLPGAVVLALVGGLPFDLPMPTHLLGLVTPTCGLTRGSTALVRGDYSLAWAYNPVSFAVIAFGATGILRAVLGVATGRWVNMSVTVRPLGRVLLITAGLLLWVHQQQHAEFIMTSRV